MGIKKVNMGLERKETYLLDKVLPFVAHKSNKGAKEFKVYDGDKIRMTSARYRMFLTKGVICVVCGIKGSFFAKERTQGKNEGYHFNLYAIDDVGEEVLMTKDHIVPKSKGGENVLENYQPMCMVCNQRKGNSTDDASKVKESHPQEITPENQNTLCAANVRNQVRDTLLDLRNQLMSSNKELLAIKTRNAGILTWVCEKEDDYNSLVVNSTTLLDDVDFLLKELEKKEKEAEVKSEKTGS